MRAAIRLTLAMVLLSATFVDPRISAFRENLRQSAFRENLRQSAFRENPPQSASPPQQQRTPEEYAKFLEGADRVSRMQVPRVVEALAVKPGMKVADLGSGSGLFTRPLAKAVAPGGVVYAIDVDAALLKIVERAREGGRHRECLHGAGRDRRPEAARAGRSDLHLRHPAPHRQSGPVPEDAPSVLETGGTHRGDRLCGALARGARAHAVFAGPARGLDERRRFRARSRSTGSITVSLSSQGR